MVALSQGDERERPVVSTGGVPCVWLGAPHVSQGVDAEGEVLHHHEAQHASDDGHTQPVAQQKSRYRDEQEVRYDGNAEPVLVLPNEHWVLTQVGDVVVGVTS